MRRFKFINGKNWYELPKTSGVYLFYNKNKLLYIGKAINIRNRVKNHFQQPTYRDNLFINSINKIGFIETNSEIEALILEANLIKKYQPKFNVVWRDDKNYFYVSIAQNDQKIPYVYITHRPKKNRDRVSISVGPFTEGTALKKTLRFLRRVFPYYTSQRHPKTKCTYCHLDLCPGPQVLSGAEGDQFLENYKKDIKKLILILKGKRKSVLNMLKKEMKQLSKENKFEEAGKMRDRIYNLQQVMAHTHVINSLTGVVGNFAGAKNLTAPTNKILQSILGIKKKISRIECYDVSNIQGKQATGSMAVFTEGKPDKSQYRKFKIKLLEKPNDTAMLKEILQRRLSHPEWEYPEVMLIDGGIAQLNVAIKAKANRNIKIISIAKGKQELWIESRKKPIPLKSLPQEIYNLVKYLDGEAHRFAITYHKKLRKEKLVG